MTSWLISLGEITYFCGRAFLEMLLPPYRVKEALRQAFRVGVESLPVVSLTAFSTGAVLAMQSASGLAKFGVVSYVAGIVGVSIVREMGPVLTAIMVAGRIGAGISAELGSMRVTEQIDAMEVSALNPMKYLVATRLAATLLMLPVLTVYADVMGILGGYLVGVTQLKIMSALYLSRTLEFVGFDDFLPGLLKTFFFGAIVGLVGCYKGYRTTGGGEGVGKSTTSAVVTASILIIIVDVLLTKLFISLF